LTFVHLYALPGRKLLKRLHTVSPPSLSCDRVSLAVA
jgi:hypothetical protein